MDPIKTSLMKKYTILLLALIATILPLHAKQTVGLVLSGGGAKGIAHVGVIKALEDNDIPIDYVTGTSMGSIVGSLYAIGWSPEKMYEFFTAPEFLYWATGKINPEWQYLLYKPSPTPAWANVNINLKNTSNLANQVIPNSLVSPLPMNIEFLKLYTPYTEQCKGNFNNLFVPFRCVFSDIYGKHKVVCSKGSLGESVRGSMSFPLVFKPIEVDGILAYDGGIYDNFPVDVMQEDFNPDFIIGVSVARADKKPRSNNVYGELEDMIIQNNDYSVPSRNGIKIQVPVLNFGVLDFSQAKTIYEIGYKTGLEMVDSIKSRVSARRSPEEVARRREAFAAQTPQVEFDSINITGANESQRNYLEYLFGDHRFPISLPEVQQSYYRAIAEGKISDLLPEAKFAPDYKSATLNLKAKVNNPWSIGIGGWITSTTNSMLYADFGYHALSYNSLDVDISAWLGQSYMAARAAATFALRTHMPSYMKLEGVISREKNYDTDLLFYETKNPSFITNQESFARITYNLGPRNDMIFGVSASYGRSADRYFADNDVDFATAKRDRSRYDMAVLDLHYEVNTLNRQQYPTSGKKIVVYMKGVHEDAKYSPGRSSNQTPEAGDEKTGNIDTPNEDLIYNHTSRWGRWRASVKAEWMQFFQLHKHFVLGARAEGLVTLSPLKGNLVAEEVHAAAFTPMPSIANIYNPAFRSDNYIAVGLVPAWIPVTGFQIRGDFYAYCKTRKIGHTDTGKAVYDGWLNKPNYIAQLSAIYSLPFASIGIYGNYLSYPHANWSFGINLGLYFKAPRLLH